MIKAEINEKKKEPVDEFPKLMMHKDGSIVLFTEYCNGTLLHDTTGSTSAGWVNQFWSMRDFTDFHGSITLSNEELTK
jgi:hypothetical protein